MPDYKNIFEQLKLFKKEQEKQKQRGFNNYNILTTVLKKSDEVRLHSRMIASFLDPSGKHFQSTLFLDTFLDILQRTDFNIDTKNCSVYREYKNIDLYITDGNKHIIIENKVYAKDQKEQIKRYIEIINKENEDLYFDDILVIYLSLDRAEPSSYSLGDLVIKDGFVQKESTNVALFQSIHYKNEILQWLEACQYEIQNITNLNEFFKQYIDVVNMINNQYKGKIMSLSDYLEKDEEVYKLAMALKSELLKVRKKIIDDFFKKLTLSLQSELGSDWVVKIDGDLAKRYKSPFKIYKSSWTTNRIIFVFAFEKDDYMQGYFCIRRYDKTINLQNDIVDIFKNELELAYKRQTTKDSLHWELLPNIVGADDFVQYIKFTDYADKFICDEIIRLIKVFEVKSNLMTDINNYLNKK